MRIHTPRYDASGRAGTFRRIKAIGGSSNPLAIHLCNDVSN
jgi:hypothetical protein